MPFLSGWEGGKWVRERLVKGRPATLAVAFWGAGAAEMLGLQERPTASGPVNIICNLALGGTNPTEIRRLMGLSGVIVKQCDRLHGKVYLFDKETLIGSANASANGLSFEGTEVEGWLEANVVLTDRSLIDDVRGWVETLPVRDILENDLERAEESWRRRRFIRRKERGVLCDPPSDDPASLIATVLADPAKFRGFGFAFTQGVATAEQRDRAAKTAFVSDSLLNEAELRAWPLEHVFSGWSRDEISAWPFEFVCAHQSRTGRIRYWFYERTHPVPNEGVVLATLNPKLRGRRGFQRAPDVMAKSDARSLEKMFDYSSRGGHRLCENGEELVRMVEAAGIKAY